MDELLKYAISRLVGYFRLFIEILCNPVRAPQRLQIFDSNKLEDALIFFGVSVVVSVVVKLPFVPDSTDHVVYALLDGLWKIILVVGASAIARLAWIRCSGTFGQYLVANCYFFGILSVLVPLAFIILSQLPPDSLLRRWYELILSLAIFVWCGAAWVSYGAHNAVSLSSTLGRLVIFVFFLPPLAITSILIRAGTVVAKTGRGYDYEAGLTELILQLASFGFYP